MPLVDLTEKEPHTQPTTHKAGRNLAQLSALQEPCERDVRIRWALSVGRRVADFEQARFNPTMGTELGLFGSRVSVYFDCMCK